MDKHTATPASRREQLRQQWLANANAAFDLLFDDDQQEQLVTFDQREQRVLGLTAELAAWLLEEHTAADPAVRPPDGVPTPCPKCQQPARRRTPPDEPLPERRLTCDAGEVTLRREQWYCTTCRVAFFPSRRAAGTRF